jgi:hypothetical protein
MHRKNKNVRRDKYCVALYIIFTKKITLYPAYEIRLCESAFRRLVGERAAVKLTRIGDNRAR